MKVKDHLGNEFSSIEEMRNHYGISKGAYDYRIQHGWSQEKALTTPMTKPVFDHIGNEYASITEMCKHYGISKQLYDVRIKLGWSLSKTLTTPVKNSKWQKKTD